MLFDSAQHIDLPPQQRGVGLLFQNYALFPNMTVEQNVLCGLKAEKDPAARRAACAEMLRAMRLEALAKRYPGQLSGGQQQRAALARILVGARILMLDEPFSALDSYLREEVEGEVGSLLANFAGTALLVTHNRDEAYRLCKEMIVLNEGQVLRAGTTKAVFADPAEHRRRAPLTGCKNILPCTPWTATPSGWRAGNTILRLAQPVPAGCTAVGIRAHDFTPCAADVPNAIPVKAVSTSENPFDWNLICTPPEGAAQLWWKVENQPFCRTRRSRPSICVPHRKASCR